MAAKKKIVPSSSTLSPQEQLRVKTARTYIESKIGLKPVDIHARYGAISTGSFLIDHAIGGVLAEDGSGPVCPGFPRRRISEVYGPEGSGKTTATLQAIAQVQQSGGIACFLDFEHALDVPYAKKLGVSFEPDLLLYYRPETFEDGIKIVNVAIQAGYDMIVVDSVPAMITKDELEKALDKADRIGSIAGALASKLRKLVVWLDSPKALNPRGGTAFIFINQVRDNVGGGGHGPEEKTPGGRALKFFSSLRLRYGSIGTATIKKFNPSGKEVTIPYGNHTRVKVVKNKMAPSTGQTTDIFIRHGEGYDNLYSLIMSGIYHKAIKKEGAWLKLGDQKHQGNEALRKWLKNNPEALAQLSATVLASINSKTVSDAAKDTEEEPELSEADQLTQSFEEDYEEDNPMEVTVDD